MTTAAPLKTLLLDTAAWDIVLDANGNFAVASPPYSLAQDVASAMRLFAGELWYDTSKGIPYFAQILGKAPPVQLFKEYMENAALTVPGVVSATCVIESFQGRTVTGYVAFIDTNGQTGTVPISS